MKVTKQNAFPVFCLLLSSYIALGDGEITESELTHLRKLVNKFGVLDFEKYVASADSLKNFLSENDQKISTGLVKISKDLNYKKLNQGLELAINMAVLDGEFDDSEKEQFMELGKLLNLSQRHIQALLQKGKGLLADLELEMADMDEQTKKKTKSRRLQEILQTDLLRCPKCDHKTLELFSHEDVDFDVCQQGCQGVWVDQGEIAIYVEAFEKDITVESSKFTPETLTKLLCPRCETKTMHLAQFHKKEPLEVEVCSSCRGLWLDHKELQEVVKITTKYNIGGNYQLAVSRLARKGFKILK
ncbi:MAG: zf-TFIIB domain-containing protein [Bacteriovoracaceae bacterium]|nr:zf-TFIIB domain-containing protein [Bacteriovoracaceae bacterium]